MYVHLGGGTGTFLPVPEIQIIGGGAHAHGRTDVQDYLLIATGAHSYAETLEITHNVYHVMGDLLKARDRYFGVADEGGSGRPLLPTKRRWPLWSRPSPAPVTPPGTTPPSP